MINIVSWEDGTTAGRLCQRYLHEHCKEFLIKESNVMSPLSTFVLLWLFMACFLILAMLFVFISWHN